MSIRKNKYLVATATIGILLNTASAAATTIEWSDVTLSGSFPNFSFSSPTLGLVNLSYSNGTEFFGIQNTITQGGVDTLALGSTGERSLTMSWSNLVVDMSIQIWDIDTISGTNGESITFITTAAVFPTSLHTTDVWDSATQTLGNDGTVNPNSDPNNFSIINFTNAEGFNSIAFDWIIDGINSSGGVGIGEVQVVPLPPAIYLFGVGILGLFGITKRKIKNKPSLTTDYGFYS